MVVAVALGVGLLGCSDDGGAEATVGTYAVAGPEAADAGDLRAASPGVRIDGRSVLLVDSDDSDDADGASLELVRLTEDDGDPVHASLRPGDHDVDILLMLNRVEDGSGARFELRYLTFDESGDVSDLFWFPWRLQVDEELATILDVPPLPVWSPDGDTVAWIEWVADGTRLRTVGWYSDDRSTNPSDATAAYSLVEVPPGAQLEAWETASDGDPVLVARGETTTWRIELELSHAPGVDRVA